MATTRRTEVMVEIHEFYVKITGVEPAGVRVGIRHVPCEHRRSVQTDGDGFRLEQYYDADYDGRLRRDIRSKTALRG